MEVFHYPGQRKGNTKVFLLIYDLADNSRRRKFATFLEGYGYRVQESAFEFCISNQKYDFLLKRIPKMISDEDLVRIYPMHYEDDVISWNSPGDYMKNDLLIC